MIHYPAHGAYIGALGAALALLWWALQTPTAHGARADYVGVDGCKNCHESAFNVWRESAHARADMALGPSPEGKCLACHATGEAPLGRTFFSGVTCEACHGPGTGYAQDDIMRDRELALLVGMRDLSTPDRRAALCAGCHRDGTRLVPFDAERAYQRIQHSSPTSPTSEASAASQRGQPSPE